MAGIMPTPPKEGCKFYKAMSKVCFTYREPCVPEVRNTLCEVDTTHEYGEPRKCTFIICADQV